ncbi:MAG: HRDC domain-containing protein [Desulfobacterales bacterium]|nr:HRDC domain-containing protein [Desulfobacterales bacterium]
MTIQYKFFVIPIKNCNDIEEDLNKFLRTVKVINIDRAFVPNGENSLWNLAIEYLMNGSTQSIQETTKEQKSKVDYRDVLSPEDFAIFAKLRDWRKEVAGQEAVPVYTIFTNEQLAKIAEKRVVSKAGLKEIENIGAARISKYGDRVLKIVSEETEKQKQNII